LNEQINPVAGKAGGALDPAEFWHAWACGAAVKIDTFSPTRDFWSYVTKPLDTLRAEWSIPSGGLEYH